MNKLVFAIIVLGIWNPILSCQSKIEANLSYYLAEDNLKNDNYKKEVDSLFTIYLSNSSCFSCTQYNNILLYYSNYRNNDSAKADMIKTKLIYNKCFKYNSFNTDICLSKFELYFYRVISNLIYLDQEVRKNPDLVSVANICDNYIILPKLVEIIKLLCESDSLNLGFYSNFNSELTALFLHHVNEIKDNSILELVYCLYDKNILQPLDLATIVDRNKLSLTGKTYYGVFLGKAETFNNIDFQFINGNRRKVGLPDFYYK